MSEITYEKAGVDIKRARKAKDPIAELSRLTHSERVLRGIGLFGGFYELDIERYNQPVLVSSIDGVGTKIKIAQMMGVFGSIGEDLVNHCTNDIMVCGADPLFFLDYLATDKLDVEIVKEVITGVAHACKKAGCALIGGETAEMPGVYVQNNIDIAGCMIGVVEKGGIIDGTAIAPGDVLIGVASNGLHTNGYSLVRKVFFELKKYAVDDVLKDTNCSLGEELLRTHRSYHELIKRVRREGGLHGISHITGGGLIDNTKRLLKADLDLQIDWSAWEVPPIFRIIQTVGGVPTEEMRNVFNMGIGLVLIVERKKADYFLGLCLDSVGEAFIIGEVLQK